MNILYIHCHDAGRYIQPYGYAVPTPNLQSFASRATIFRNAHTAAPTCSPSRSCLLTGTYAHECMLGLVHRGFPLAQRERHLAPYLANRGYHTALAGIQHESTKSQTLYQEVLQIDPEIHYTPEDEGTFYIEKDIATAKASARFLKRDHEAPFFLSCGFFLPHREFPLQSTINPNTVRPPEPLADTADNRIDWARYQTAVQAMDRAAGIVLDALYESGRDQDTIVIFTSDHGPAFPEMKCRLTNFGTNVAFILDFPDNPARGQAIDTLVSQLDIFPTFAELARITRPDWLRGKSLVSVLRGSEKALHAAIYAQVNFHAAYEPMRSIHTDRYKLIRILDKDTRPVPPNIDNSVSKDFWLKTAAQLEHASSPLQLFDLWSDPMERHNLANDPANSGILADLAARLEAHMEATKDPFRLGSISAPSGVTVTPRSNWTP